ncbi:MAG: nucleoside kinase, partial [Elusimicrobia bacterium]|nr:nucleoside kinase [Elusimicrobiota bacterium]
SSSGKTTFIKRLAIQLRVNGLVPVEISLDDYFVPRSKTPRKKSGEYDFECLEALDISFFSKQIISLLSGQEIELPKYDFKTGNRGRSGNKLKLQKNSIIIVEGIHALNPKLSLSLPEEIKFKIFVSALTQLRIDNDTRIFTSDSRLIRRIVRDSLFRGYSAFESIKRFPLVREGEDSYVFPFQDDADIFFDSSLIYEQAVLKPMLIERLSKIQKEGPKLFEARRLMNYLDFFIQIPADEVPQNSILREFIGDSGFSY